MSAIWHEAEMLAGRLGGPLAEGKRTNPGRGKTGAIDSYATLAGHPTTCGLNSHPAPPIC
jgi:hypothetical protein